MALPPETTPSSDDKASKQRAAEQQVFAREVDDAMRQDQLESFMSRYGKPLFAAIVIAMAAFGGWIYWQHEQTRAREEHAETFIQALDDVQANNLDAAKQKLEGIVGEDTKGNSIPVKLLLAGIALEKDDKAGALKLYGEVSGDAGAPQPFRDLATVRSVAANFDEMKPQDVVDKLKPLAAPGNPWFGVAGEMVGMAYLKMGKTDQAGPLFAAIAKDEKVSESVRGRTRQLAAVLGVDSTDAIVGADGEPLADSKSKKGAADAPAAAADGQ